MLPLASSYRFGAAVVRQELRIANARRTLGTLNSYLNRNLKVDESRRPVCLVTGVDCICWHTQKIHAQGLHLRKHECCSSIIACPTTDEDACCAFATIQRRCASMNTLTLHALLCTKYREPTRLASMPRVRKVELRMISLLPYAREGIDCGTLGRRYRIVSLGECIVNNSYQRRIYSNKVQART
jgi:hypothetical protein